MSEAAMERQVLQEMLDALTEAFGPGMDGIINPQIETERELVAGIMSAAVQGKRAARRLGYIGDDARFLATAVAQKVNGVDKVGDNDPTYTTMGAVIHAYAATMAGLDHLASAEAALSDVELAGAVSQADFGAMMIQAEQSARREG